MSRETINFTPQLYDYFLNTSLRDHPILNQLRAETLTMPGARMQIAPEQGQFMALLIELIGAQKTLDIGVYTGYSSLVVAMALPANGKVVACDVNVESTNVAKRYWQMAGVSDKIDLRIAPASETLQYLIDRGESGTYDFAFIDADKNNYSTYYELTLELLRPGGLVAIDNVLWSGKVAEMDNQEQDTLALRALNQAILQDERVTMSMIPIADGLTLARKR